MPNLKQALKLLPTRFRKGVARRQFIAQDGLCFICEQPLDSTTDRDHFIPRGQGGHGGHGGWCNSTLTHRRCNGIKAQSIPMVAHLVKYKMICGRWPKMNYGSLERVYTKEEFALARQIFAKTAAAKQTRNSGAGG